MSEQKPKVANHLAVVDMKPKLREKFWESFSKAQVEAQQSIKRNSQSQIGAKKYNYANLETVTDHLNEICTKHGLVLIQYKERGFIENAKDLLITKVFLPTLVGGIPNQDFYIDKTVAFEGTLNDEYLKHHMNNQGKLRSSISQIIGADETYAKRRALSRAFRFSTKQEDDDAGLNEEEGQARAVPTQRQSFGGQA